MNDIWTYVQIYLFLDLNVLYRLKFKLIIKHAEFKLKYNAKIKNKNHQ